MLQFVLFFPVCLTVWGCHLVFAYGCTPYGKWTFRDLVVANFCPSSLRTPSCCLPRKISVSSLTVRYANNLSHLAEETWVTIMSRNFEPLCHLKSCNRPNINVKKLVSGKSTSHRGGSFFSFFYPWNIWWRWEERARLLSFGGWPVLVAILFAAGCCFSWAVAETYMDGESVEKCLSFSLAHFQQEKMKVVKANNDNLESQKQAQRHSRWSASLSQRDNKVLLASLIKDGPECKASISFFPPFLILSPFIGHMKKTPVQKQKPGSTFKTKWTSSCRRSCDASSRQVQFLRTERKSPEFCPVSNPPVGLTR